MTATLFFLVAALLIVLPYLAWRFFGLRRITPLAVLQILTGLILGPSVLGVVAPDIQKLLFPPDIVSRIGAISAFAVVLYTFVTGMHLDMRELRKISGSAGIAWGSFLLPMAFGVAMGWLLYESGADVRGQQATELGFSLAIGLLIAVTALPVLAALLKEIGRLHTPLGQQALGFAAINDAGLWVGVSLLLVFLVPDTHGQYPFWLPIYVGVMALTGWALNRAADRLALAMNQDLVLIGAVALAFLSAYGANLTGLGYVFGAFVAGYVIPPVLRHALIERLEKPAILLLMPFFFMNTGLKTETGLLSAETLALTALLTGAAIVSKIIGASLPALLSGQPWRRALSLGMLLQTKGLMEVLVATILLEAGVINATLFSALVLMAVICTTIATPVVQRLMRHESD